VLGEKEEIDGPAPDGDRVKIDAGGVLGFPLIGATDGDSLTKVGATDATIPESSDE
jgi:hypothetical protein